MKTKGSLTGGLADAVIGTQSALLGRVSVKHLVTVQKPRQTPPVRQLEMPSIVSHLVRVVSSTVRRHEQVVR